MTVCRRLLAALAVAVLAAAPARGEMFAPETFTLENGLEVVVVENRRAPVVVQMIWYKVGAADEPEGYSGVAHFLEHLMFRGTERFGPGEFSRIVARHGGQDNAFVSYDYTAFFQRVAREHLGLVMELEADRMTNLVISDAVVEPERDVVIEERRTRTDNRPEGLLREQAQAALYLNHPYRLPVIGWMHEIEALDRASAEAFYRRYYHPNNAVLIIAGDVSADEVRPLAEQHFGAIAQGDIPPRVRPAEPPHNAARRVELRSPTVEQPSWQRYYIAPSYNRGASEHAYALQVLSELLGGGPTSRLYRALVVDQGVASAAGTFYDPGRYDLGQFAISATPRAGGALDAIEAAIERELARLLADGVTEDEVARAIRLAEANAIYARDSLMAAPNIIGRALTTGRTVADVEAWPERIRAVTVAEVEDAARAVLVPQNAVTALLLAEPPS